MLNMAVSPCVEVDIYVSENSDTPSNRVRIHAVDYGEVFFMTPEKPDYSLHPLLQGAVSSLPIPEDKKLDISIRSSFPAGSATGTSASVCVALLGALDVLSSKRHSPVAIAALAHRVETDKLHLQSGIQDQLCAAVGGVCDIRMHKYPEARVFRLSLSEEIIKKLDLQLCLIYLGTLHRSSDIHERVIESFRGGTSRKELLRNLRSLAEAGKSSLKSEDLVQFGRVMIENNELQRSLHPELISKKADAVIKIAKKYGAFGWKVNGAGGEGGSLTVLSGPDRMSRKNMIFDIKSLGYGISHLPSRLSSVGLKVNIDPVLKPQ